MRVLVVVWGRRVEVLQASPLVRSLAAGLPGSTISVACSPAAAPVARALEGVSEVLPLRGLDPGAPLLSGLAAWARLRRRRFDAAVVCGTAARVRWLVYLAGFARRVGAGGGLTAVLLSDRLSARARENRAATWIRLAPLLGVTAERHEPRLEPGTDATRQASAHFHSSGIADGRLVVALAPGTGHAERGRTEPAPAAWDTENWAHLANQLAARHGAGVIFVGAAEDEEAVIAAQLDVAAPHADLTGQLDVLGTAALLQLCDLVISGDSPLLHLSAAVGTPTVGLFGPTDGSVRGPYGREHRVVQAVVPWHGHRRGYHPGGSLEQIRVEDVLAGIETAL